MDNNDNIIRYTYDMEAITVLNDVTLEQLYELRYADSMVDPCNDELKLSLIVTTLSTREPDLLTREPI